MAFFTRKSPSKKETTKEVARCKIGIDPSLYVSDVAFINSKRFPPKMVGIERRKENLTASLAFHPRILAQEIVEALLEIPGIKAVDCIVPIMSTSLIFPINPSFFDLAIQKDCPASKIAPVPIKQNPKR
jgi:hypothetical protein